MRCAAVQQVPPQVTMVAAELEAKMVLFNVVEEVLASTGLKPCQVRSVCNPWAGQGRMPLPSTAPCVKCL